MLVEQRRDQLGEEALAGPEVVVDERLGDARLAGDVAERGRADPGPVGAAPRRAEDGRPRARFLIDRSSVGDVGRTASPALTRPGGRVY
ncbi:MAG TPA: hypothetical protein VFM93_10325 [Candidatus Limnocylindria bacterium]|nr:hypothetical protein [Candidatus Limnocylindria bacterium]